MEGEPIRHDLCYANVVAFGLLMMGGCGGRPSKAYP